MSAGTAILWHANYKINADTFGFNFKVHFADVLETEARTRGNLIGQYMRKLLPVDAEVFFATINKDDTKKDSRFLPDACGVGQYVLPGMMPPPSTFDNSRTALLVRFENEDGGVVTRKFAPIPDNVVAGGVLVSSITSVTAPVVGPIPAPGAGADWYAEYTNFLKYLVVNTNFVSVNHAPGGPYTYFAWTGAYPLKIGVKRGARVFR